MQVKKCKRWRGGRRGKTRKWAELDFILFFFGKNLSDQYNPLHRAVRTFQHLVFVRSFFHHQACAAKAALVQEKKNQARVHQLQLWSVHQQRQEIRRPSTHSLSQPFLPYPYIQKSLQSKLKLCIEYKKKSRQRCFFFFFFIVMSLGETEKLDSKKQGSKTSKSTFKQRYRSWPGRP